MKGESASKLLSRLLKVLPASYNSAKVNDAIDVIEEVCKRYDAQRKLKGEYGTKTSITRFSQSS